ncbi:response regulator [Trichocoleus sp. FACHB-262]|uniref:response regulator n=1 Tax=Trichocoleus sp. FACHB-262 TaxID=2692869 RepID=UPI0016847DD4|nr:response regulator [Trichocoleus sp. FACHB-262]MBD2120842.1 response regulator [Trichocoleus sp. FACHB-262]
MSKRILLVEDNEIHRLFTQDFLESQGYQVLSLCDGIDFLETVTEFQPDLLILDLRLPQVDGFTLLQELQQSQWHALPVVVVTAYAFYREKQRALRMGVRSYLTKPVKLEAIIQAIEVELSLN